MYVAYTAVHWPMHAKEADLAKYKGKYNAGYDSIRAVRDGRWKLVAKGPSGPWELYDMEADRTEMNNLAAQQPERVKQLAAAWEAWAGRAQVIPWIWNPPYGEPAANAPATKAGRKQAKQ